MKANCQVNYVVSKCGVTRPLSKKVYLGLSEGEWKSRFYNHKYQLNTGDIPIKQHFQVICGT